MPLNKETEPLLYFYINGFDIKYPMKVDMPLNKENKPLLYFYIDGFGIK